MDVLCSVDVAAVRAELNEDAERVTEFLRGEPVEVEERRPGWVRIRTAYDYPGWVREDELSGVKGDPIEEARRYLGAPYPSPSQKAMCVALSSSPYVIKSPRTRSLSSTAAPAASCWSASRGMSRPSQR